MRPPVNLSRSPWRIAQRAAIPTTRNISATVSTSSATGSTPYRLISLMASTSTGPESTVRPSGRSTTSGWCSNSG